VAIAQLGWLKLCFFVIPQTWGLISPFPWTVCLSFLFFSFFPYATFFFTFRVLSGRPFFGGEGGAAFYFPSL